METNSEIQTAFGSHIGKNEKTDFKNYINVTMSNFTSNIENIFIFQCLYQFWALKGKKEIKNRHLYNYKYNIWYQPIKALYQL